VRKGAFNAAGGAVDFFNEFVFFLIDGKISVFSLGNDESFARLRLNGNAVERDNFLRLRINNRLNLYFFAGSEVARIIVLF